MQYFHVKPFLFKDSTTFLLNFLAFHLGKPSRVIHIRNIPNEASDAEVINLGLQFGRVTNVLVLKGKNQAFLEMADEISATAMVSVFNTTPPTVRGRTVYVQFSNHRELKTDQNHSITVRVFKISLERNFNSLLLNHLRHQHLDRPYHWWEMILHVNWYRHRNKMELVVPTLYSG